MIPLPTVTVSALKFGSPKIAATSCMITSFTSELTTALNAMPMITATARSRTLPRITKSRKSLSSLDMFSLPDGGRGPVGTARSEQVAVDALRHARRLVAAVHLDRVTEHQ